MSKKLESYNFVHVPSEVLVILIVVLPLCLILQPFPIDIWVGNAADRVHTNHGEPGI